MTGFRAEHADLCALRGEPLRPDVLLIGHRGSKGTAHHGDSLRIKLTQVLELGLFSHDVQAALAAISRQPDRLDLRMNQSGETQN